MLQVIGLNVSPSDQCVSFEAEEGTLVGMKRSNRASFLLNCLYRTVIPGGGQIWYKSSLFGRLDLTKATFREIVKLRINEMRLLYPLTAIIPIYGLSVLDIIAERLLHQGCSAQQARTDAQSLLERFRIDEKMWHTSPTACSNEQRQCMNWARALVARPRLFIMNESAADMLDVITKREILSIMKEMMLNGTTVIGIFEESSLWERAVDQMLDISYESAPSREGDEIAYMFPTLAQ
jgi:alpha-D-ribose 1-methylphosphonate 5-triphosphate synthase subunit PhnL